MIHISVAIMQLYAVIHGASIETTTNMAEEFIQRMYVGILIEFFFNTCCVLIQTHCMNIPVLRVWRIRWRAHITVCIITTVMSVLYYTDNVIDVIKKNLSEEGIVSGTNTSCAMNL